MDLLATVMRRLELLGELEDHSYDGIELLRHGVPVKGAKHVEGLLEVHRRRRSHGRHDKNRKRRYLGHKLEVIDGAGAMKSTTGVGAA